jgi:sulfite reductase alpha subunit-like flavoprotein
VFKFLFTFSLLFVRIKRNRNKCLILYASETGRAEKFAEMAMTVFSRMFNCRLLEINSYNFDRLDQENLILVIASTTGNGEAPYNGNVNRTFLINMRKRERNSFFTTFCFYCHLIFFFNFFFGKNNKAFRSSNK